MHFPGNLLVRSILPILTVAAVLMTSGCGKVTDVDDLIPAIKIGTPDTVTKEEPAGQETVVEPGGSTVPEQPGKEVASPPRAITLDFVVSVPYWTEGTVYIGNKDNPAAIRMQQINEVTWRASAEVPEGSPYYYTLGTSETKELPQTRTFEETPLVRDAVTGWQHAAKEIEKPGFQKGVTFGGMMWREDQIPLIDDSLALLPEFGVDHIILIPDWFVFPGVRGNEVRPFYRTDGEFPNPTNWITPTLSDSEVIHIIETAQSLGIEVVLKPHVDPIDFGMTPGSSRGALYPTDWDAWFESYTDFILHYAEIAETYDVKMLVVGTELDTATLPYLSESPPNVTERWRGLIAEVRNAYSGLLTYSVSCHGDCGGPEGIEFWDDLDYIGFEPYFGITDKNDPTIDELVAGFEEKLDAYALPLAEKWGKPVLLTETNCYAFDGVNRDPIAGDIQKISAQASSVNDLALDLQEQADYYEALFRAVETRDWIEGVYWWGWYLDSSLPGSDAWQLTDRFDPFVRKIAGQVLKKWYSVIKVD